MTDDDRRFAYWCGCVWSYQRKDLAEELAQLAWWSENSASPNQTARIEAKIDFVERVMDMRS